MLVNLDLLLKKVAGNPNTLQRLNESELKKVWNSLVDHVYRQLLAGRGVNIKEFGNFSFVTEVREGADGYSKSTFKRPVFNVAEKLLRAADLVSRRVRTPGSVPASQLNASSMVAAAGTSKDIITAAVKDILRSLYESLRLTDTSPQIRDGFPVNLDFRPIGRFVSDKGIAAFKFNKSFLSEFGAPMPSSARRTPLKAEKSPRPSSSGSQHETNILSIHDDDKNEQKERKIPSRSSLPLPPSRPSTGGQRSSRPGSSRSQKAMELVRNLKNGNNGNVPGMTVTSLSARPSSSRSRTSEDGEHEEINLHEFYKMQIKQREDIKAKEKADAERLMEIAIENSNKLYEREITENEKRRRMREQVDAYNKKIMRKHVSKRHEEEQKRLEGGKPRSVGDEEEKNGAEVQNPEVLSDIFAARKEPVLMSMNPRELQQELKRQMAAKIERKRRERESDRLYFEETASKAMKELEKEKAVLNETKVDRFRKRREELEGQIRNRSGQLPAAAGNAVTETLPRPDDIESIRRRKQKERSIMEEQLVLAEERREVQRQQKEIERIRAEKEVEEVQRELDQESEKRVKKKRELQKSLRSSWEEQKAAMTAKPVLEVENTSLIGVKYFEPPKSKTFGVLKSTIPSSMRKKKQQGNWM